MDLTYIAPPNTHVQTPFQIKSQLDGLPFQDKGRNCVLSYPRAHEEVPENRDKLASKLLNPKETGYKYLTDHFKEMLLRLFPNIDNL